MTGELRDMLARKADEAGVPSVDPNALIAQGRGLVRRRRLRALSAVTAAVAVAAVIVGVNVLDSDVTPRQIGPANPSSSQSSTGAPDRHAARSDRPLTYAAGRVVHLGERTVEAGGLVQSLDVTDDGAVFTTADGRIWFTDGSDAEQIGATTGGTTDRGSERWAWFGPRWWVATGNSGSLVAWFDRIGAGDTDLVLYDTRERREVGRATVHIHKGWRGVLDAVTDDTLFWSEQGPPGDDFYWVYQVGASPREVSRRAWFAGMSREPRHFLVDDSYGDGMQFTDETAQDHHDFPLARFIVDTGRVVPDSPPGRLFYSHPGKRVQDLELVPSLPDATVLWVAEWLDDDRYVVMDEAQDLVTCVISNRRCTVTVPGSSLPEHIVVPTFPS